MTAAVSVATKAVKVAKGAGPKAAAATKGAGGRAGTAAKASSARTSTGARAGGARTTAAQQRAEIQAIKDARPAEDTAPAQTPSRELPGAVNDGVRAANTGGGFLLGLGAWVLARTYLDGGSDGVKKLLKAKFFNQVDG